MPYGTNSELPASVRRNLPPHAKDIYREAFNNAFDEYFPDESGAFRVAWAAVKKQYRKDDRGRWVPKNELR